MIPGIIRILRPVNSIVAGLAALLAFFIATGTLVPTTLLLFPIVFCITAAGNVVNDWYDVEIDAVNRPDRPLPSGTVRMATARLLAILLFLAGIGLSVLTTPLCLMIAVVNSIVLVLYAARLKRVALIGNMTVSYLSASIFLFGGALGGMVGMARILPIALITFLAMVSRELLKASEDLEGDMAAGARTLPVMIGVRKTAIIAFIFAIGAIIASVIPVSWWGLYYLAGIGIIDLVIFIGAAMAITCISSSCIKTSRATTSLKFGMFASLLVFTLSALFL
jgi:geranylgeranylglycerol-phosphate geranylgeranyltransferase